MGAMRALDGRAVGLVQSRNRGSLDSSGAASWKVCGSVPMVYRPPGNRSTEKR